MKVIIYKLIDLTTGEFYIGSTKNLRKRINAHRTKNNKCRSRAIINNNNYEFIILDERFVYNKENKIILENIYVLLSRKLSDKCINYQIPHRFKGYKKFYDRQKYLYGGKREKMLNKYYSNKGVICN